MSAGVFRPDIAELYTPKLVTVLREGYGLDKFKADAISGLTVAIVALPSIKKKREEAFQEE